MKPPHLPQQKNQCIATILTVYAFPDSAVKRTMSAKDYDKVTKKFIDPAFSPD
jgi:hypothetical protein